MAPQIISPGHALLLTAIQDLQTSSGKHRATGETWLVRDVGAYLPGVFEEVSISLSIFSPSLSLAFTHSTGRGYGECSYSNTETGSPYSSHQHIY